MQTVVPGRRLLVGGLSMFRRDFLTGLFGGLFPVVAGCSKTTPPSATDADATSTGETPKPKNPFRNDGAAGDATPSEADTVEQKCTACGGGGKVTGRCDACTGTGLCRMCSGSGGQRCTACDGKGQIPGRIRNPDCSYCDGRGAVACTKCDRKRVCGRCEGKDVQVRCDVCRGSGSVRVPKR